jgi:hypothetical protein
MPNLRKLARMFLYSTLLGAVICALAVVLWPIAHWVGREAGIFLVAAGGFAVLAGLWGRWRAKVFMVRLTRAWEERRNTIASDEA